MVTVEDLYNHKITNLLEKHAQQNWKKHIKQNLEITLHRYLHLVVLKSKNSDDMHMYVILSLHSVVQKSCK